MIRLRGVHKVYGEGGDRLEVLRGVDLDVRQGDLLAIVGESGTGKSTLLNLVGGLDRAYTGDVSVLGQDLHKLNDKALAAYRNAQVGFVFQSFNLIPPLTVLQNVLLPTYFGEGALDEDREHARAALARVGLSGKENRLPGQLSGGERQRVALARALFRRPKVLLADEPTGSLDARTGAGVIDLLTELNGEGLTMIVVTHESRVANACKRVVRLKEGHLHEEAAAAVAVTR